MLADEFVVPRWRLAGPTPKCLDAAQYWTPRPPLTGRLTEHPADLIRQADVGCCRSGGTV